MNPVPPQNDYVVKLLIEVHSHFGKKSLPSDLITRFPHLGEKTVAKLDLADLWNYPGLQQALAYIVNYTPTKWLLEQEAETLKHIRSIHEPESQLYDYQPGQGKDIYDWARDGQLSGLCFSGGGIRSATFNLGILQGLAEHDWLRRFDYLSTVSGGGYVHSWLAAWLKRKTDEIALTKTVAKAPDDISRDGLCHVTDRLKPLPGRRDSEPIFQTVWPRQIQWLRRYSNYLTPQVGFFSGDTWSAAAIWIRNALLNQTLLVSIFLCLLALPYLLGPRGQQVRIAAPPSSAATAIISTHSQGVDTTTQVKLQVKSDSFALRVPQPCAHNGRHPQCTYWSGPNFGNRVFKDPITFIRANRLGLLNFWTRLTFRLRSVMVGLTPLAYLLFFCATLAIGLLLHNEYVCIRWADQLQTETHTKLANGQPTRFPGEPWIALGIVIFLLLYGIILTESVVRADCLSSRFVLALFVSLLALIWVVTFSGGALRESNLARTSSLAAGTAVRRRIVGDVLRWSRLVVLGIPAALTGMVGGVAIATLIKSSCLADFAEWLKLDSAASVQIVLGGLLFFWLPFFTLIAGSGLVGRWFPDWLSEWMARLRGYSLMTGIGWFAFCGTSLFMPGVVRHVLEPGWIKWPTILGWAGTTVAGALGGRSAKTGGQENGDGGKLVLKIVVIVGPYVYIFGLMVLLACGIERLHHDLSRLAFWMFAFVGPLLIAIVLGCTLDINEFSMCSFYRNRLTRCYLGASNLTRDPSPITGFDDRDTRGLQVSRLVPDEENMYPGPFPIFCCSVNITVGEDLAWQERKAASFAFTPLYSGYTVGWSEGREGLQFNGFVPTHSFAYPDGPNLATAMAASGAAVSPNWGYHTNPATAFLMTMFDVRLGWWLPNPRRLPTAGTALNTPPPTQLRSTPRFAPLWLLKELLGSVNDTSSYVYLTDGGHFDNMGLYELVRRRCYRIVICDAEEDASYTYEGIGMAIRKCRIDFGAEIDLDLSDLTPNSDSKLSPAHIARGTIRYPETPKGKEGKVLYIKASLTGKSTLRGGGSKAPVKGEVKLPDVPGDVQNYKLQHQRFPQDSTADQWFTESQFESYRRLGQTVVEKLNGALWPVTGHDEQEQP